MPPLFLGSKPSPRSQNSLRSLRFSSFPDTATLATVLTSEPSPAFFLIYVIGFLLQKKTTKVEPHPPTPCSRTSSGNMAPGNSSTTSPNETSPTSKQNSTPPNVSPPLPLQTKASPDALSLKRHSGRRQDGDCTTTRPVTPTAVNGTHA